MATPAACVAISDVYKTCPPSRTQRPRALRVSLIKSHPNQHCTILLQVQPNDHVNVFEHFWKRHCKINSGSMQVSAYFPQNWLAHQGFATVKHFVSGGVVPIQTPQRLRLCSFLLLSLACQESLCSCRGWPGVPDFAANHPTQPKHHPTGV